MVRNLLLVDDQRDILRLLRSTLDTLKNKDIQIYEAQSGEEAMLESSRHKIDMLVSDYKLPGISGVELMHKVRARHPEVKVIFITGMTEKKMRDEMLNSGAFAIFDKPIPMADFLDSVERGLGLVQTIFPPEHSAGVTRSNEPQQTRLSDLLANFRQDFNADAVFLLNERGLINARTGNLHDPSMEVSLISTLMAIHSTSMKVARHNHQENIESYHVFSGGDHDLLFIPVTPLYALLVAGKRLAGEDQILDSVRGLVALRGQVEKALASMGVTGELKSKIAPLAAPPVMVPKKQTDQLAKATPAPEMEALLKQGSSEKPKEKSTDDFWESAAQDLGRKSLNPEVISLEEAKKMGLVPGSE